MKSLNNIIQEKLIINKNSKIKALEFDFDGFKNFLSKELNYEIKKLNLDFIQRYSENLYNKIKESTFTEISNNDGEWNYYLTKIANCQEDAFKRCYVMKEMPKSFAIFSYRRPKDESPEEYYSVIGYILGDMYNNFKNRNKIRIFKYEIIE